MPNNTFSRLNLGVNADTKLGNKVNLGLTFQYIKSGGTRIEQGSNTSGVMLGLLRTTPTFDNSNGLSVGDDGFDAAYEFPNGTPRGYRGLAIPASLRAHTTTLTGRRITTRSMTM
ncbi:MAG: hypothetical protein IPJ40_14750 [Saprospirales bacterium]|nr:hypothetical protein [Saprospirales bacterium]